MDNKFEEKLHKEIVAKEKASMRAFYFSFYGVWLGGYGVVNDTTKKKALNRANRKLKEDGFEPIKMDDIHEIITNKPNCEILWNGDY